MDARSKRAMLEDQRKRWMDDRQNFLAQKEALSATKNEVYAGKERIRNEGANKESGRVLTEDSDFLNKLTDRISHQIRMNVKEELSKNMNMNMGDTDIRNSVVERMDRYLEAELHTHICKICYELMLSPKNTPMLLFPCGHTFCRECFDKHNSVKKNSLCPYCRQPIDSAAINQSLKELIDNFAGQREKIKNGQFKDVFCSTKKNNRGSTLPLQDDKSYKAQITANKMRCAILENQLEEDATELEKIKKRKKNIANATTHLKKERKATEEKLLLLQEEISLIDSHLNEQQQKFAEADKNESSLSEAMALVRMSIASIQNEIEKLNLLSECGTDP